jgi:hypothetical protein
MTRKRLIVALSAVILVGGAVAWWQWNANFKDTNTSKDTLTAQSVDVKTKANAASNTAHDGHDHEIENLLIELASVPGKYPHFDFNANRFNAGKLDNAGNYPSAITKVVLDASCANREDVPSASLSLETQLQQDFAISAQRRVPDDVFFESLTQFFKAGDRYYQFSAFARAGSRPPIYTLEFYSAADAGMQAGLVREAVPVTSNVQIDAVVVESVLAELLAKFRSQNYVEGARMMDIRVAGREGQQDQAIRYFNQLPVQWVFGTGLCQLSTQQGVSHCRCLPEQESLKAAEY